jgi:hypothetical protein
MSIFHVLGFITGVAAVVVSIMVRRVFLGRSKR